MLASTYGLQAIIFILKREFMLVGWMIVYIMSYVVIFVHHKLQFTLIPSKVSDLQFLFARIFILVDG